jgi:nucleoside phosphorylase
VGSVRRRSKLLVIPLAAAVAWGLPATGGAAGKTGLCATARKSEAAPPYLGILSAFPAELAPFVAATVVETTVEIDARLYYVGRLDGVRVVLGLTGTGLRNAESRTNTLLANFELAALLMSGVAGSRHRIGDVVLASAWEELGGSTVFNVNPALLAIGERAGKRLRSGSLETCTPVPPRIPDAPVVCLAFDPAIVLEGHGISSDPLTTPHPCSGTHDIFGCTLPPASAATGVVVEPISARSRAAASEGLAPTAITEDLVDMETAVVARVAEQHGVPFLGVRAVSDGAGDPLGPNRAAQFFDYYRLAAENAAVVTRAMAREIARLPRNRSGRRVCRLLAKGNWPRAAARIRAFKKTSSGASY